MLNVADFKDEQKKSFEAFMKRSEIKSLISMTPSNDHVPDALQSLLSATYDHAYESGTAGILLSLLKDQFAKESNDES